MASKRLFKTVQDFKSAYLMILIWFNGLLFGVNPCPGRESEQSDGAWVGIRARTWPLSDLTKVHGLMDAHGTGSLVQVLINIFFYITSFRKLV